MLSMLRMARVHRISRGCMVRVHPLDILCVLIMHPLGILCTLNMHSPEKGNAAACVSLFQGNVTCIALLRGMSLFG